MLTALGRLSLGAGLALLLASTVLAQQQKGPKVNATTLAFQYLTGRYRMPVTCVRTDGSSLELEEAIVIRRYAQHSGEANLKATFFGIDAADLSHCFNVLQQRIPDRRGTLYLTFRSFLRRTDLGMSDIRRRMRNGELRFPIQDGKLRERAIGEDEAEPRVIEFKRRGLELLVRQVRPGSDADKLLARYAGEARESKNVPRRFEFEINGPDDFSFRSFVIEDVDWRR